MIKTTSFNTFGKLGIWPRFCSGVQNYGIELPPDFLRRVRFWYYSSRMVVVTYVHLRFLFYLNIFGAFWAVSERFWVISSIFEDFFTRVKFWYCSSRMIVVTYFHFRFVIYLEQFWGILGSSKAFLGHFEHFWRLFEKS